MAPKNPIFVPIYEIVDENDYDSDDDPISEDDSDTDQDSNLR